MVEMMRTPMMFMARDGLLCAARGAREMGIAYMSPYIWFIRIPALCLKITCLGSHEVAFVLCFPFPPHCPRPPLFFSEKKGDGAHVRALAITWRERALCGPGCAVSR